MVKKIIKKWGLHTFAYALLLYLTSCSLKDKMFNETEEAKTPEIEEKSEPCEQRNPFFFSLLT